MSSLREQLPGLLGPSRRAAWRRVVLRRGASVLLLLLALHLAMGAVRQPASGQPVLVASADIPAGEVIRPEQVATSEQVSAPPASAPSDPAAVVGRRATVAIESGEVLTPARATGTGALEQLPADHRALTLPLIGPPPDIGPGDRVDVHLGGEDEPVVSDALVVAADPPAADGLGAAGGGDGARVVVAVPAGDAGRLVSALGTDQMVGFVIAIRP